MDNFFFDVNQALDIFADSRNFQRITAYNLSTNGFDLDIWSCCYLVYEVSNGKFRAFRQNVQNVFAFDKVAAFDRSEDVLVSIAWNEWSVLVFFSWLLENDNSVVVHQELQESLFLSLKQTTWIVF